jgi:molybdopterin synthase sulfur carrier subunit
MPEVTIRYWAAAKEAAGLAEEKVSASTLSEALDTICAQRADDPRFKAVIARSSFLINETPAGTRDTTTIALPSGAVIEVLPAFAGG